jgi:hypothetical protein
MFARQEAITGPVLKSQDAREGAAAFADRRAPGCFPSPPALAGGEGGARCAATGG